MSENYKKFKPSPKKYHPKGLSIIYEDLDLLVVNKVSGLLTISTGRLHEKTAHRLLNEYVRKGNPKSRKRIFIVHRLDKDASGIIVFAKNKKTKQYLQEQWSDFKKIYYVVVHGTPTKKQDTITSYLAENNIHKMYSVNDPKKGKLSKTKYKVLKESKQYSLLKINLLTGRKNQIRVHLSELGYPIAGDKKYGEAKKGIKQLALHSFSLTISHPHTKEKMIFTTKMPDYFKLLVNK